jgi:hypothetical protein
MTTDIDPQNPSSEPIRNIAPIARVYSRLALAVLVHAVRHSADERVRVDAAKELLIRGWGRPSPAEPVQPPQTPEQGELALREFLKDLSDGELIGMYTYLRQGVSERDLEECAAQVVAAKPG